MQRGKRRELPKRSRYYQGSIDLDLITVGEPYEKLKNSFVIFICTFDPFGEGRHLYTFVNTCKENPNLALNDGTTKVFLNTKGKIEDVDYEMKEFLAYIEDSTDEFVSMAKSPLIKELHMKVTEVKQSKELEAEYMTLLQRDRENIEKGIEQGIEQGLEQGLEQGIEQGLEQGEKKMALLTKYLVKAGRFQDLERAAEDEVFRKQLFQEFGI